MEAKIYNRLTEKEKELISNLEEKAAKRPHKKTYDIKFIVNYMSEGFKDFSYDEKQDAMDMLDAILEVARKCGVYTKAQAEKERKYMIKEEVNRFFEDEADDDEDGDEDEDYY